MELNKACVEDLSNLKELISKSHDYEKLINCFIEIINRNHILDNGVKNEIVLNSRLSAEVEMSLDEDADYTIYGSVSGIEDYAQKLAVKFYKDFSNVDKSEINLLFIITFLLHETAHLYQLSLARKCDDLLGRVYNLVIKQTDKYPLYSSFVYNIMRFRLFYERSANVIAFREIEKIYENTDLLELTNLFYNYYLISGYTEKKNSYISPMEKTFKYLGIKEKIDTSNIPFDEVITHGLPICQKEKLDDLLTFFELKNLSEISYSEVRKKILELR